MKRSFIREILEVIGSDTVSFAGGLPDESLFPIEAMQKASQEVLSTPGALQYSITAGIPTLRQKLADYYTGMGLETKSENILITTGAQQALDLISRIYFREGTVVEAPAYLGALNAFSANDCPMYPVPLNDSGLDLHTFEEMFKQTKRAYLMCDFQNPTGICYSDEVRQKLARIAIHHNGIIVEDGAYMELFFEERLAPMSLYAPDHTLHVGSFSKTLAPGLRLGWIRGDEKLLQPILALKERADLHTSALSQHLAERFWESGLFGKHLRKIRSAYKRKCDALADELTSQLSDFCFIKPKGGMFIYGTFPEEIDAKELALACLKNGAVFVPGGEFYPDTCVSSEARFNFSNTTPEEMRRGISIIAQTYKAYMHQKK
ncbi:PLP-dependent aminotransferase family protein [Sulfuricurvum sp.]|uniref:aminotransferase-like domain-containing protein n=1 Tax=Sulfuricurvum sp. TaxID=2025608 RepID=UPI002E2F9019|nr:PLP-dependent aminotransferase family protein [Sulfuricurvum sp.]HEX5329549.1 PLP-dependent aminotransferase family protein [Sulfuricurvum sp.]